MPLRAPRICSCGLKVAYGVRCVCQVRARTEADKCRPNARERGYDTTWQKARSHYLDKHPRCVMCSAAARVVDHIKPHRGDTKLFWDRSNWQSLCFFCHDSRKQRMERAS